MHIASSHFLWWALRYTFLLYEHVLGKRLWIGEETPTPIYLR